MRFAIKQEEDYSLKLTALIDVVFLLLIFFMVSTAFVDFTRRLDIELPDAKSGAPTQKTKVYTVEINRQGKIFVDGQRTDLLDLASKIKTHENSTKRSVIIRADKRLFYGLAVEVMGICRESGINDIGLAVL
ncbi:MAG: biopolymer transporter ExbD [bacterium]|nr:MAG: biopolymer transporter ExbD [bacterium]